MAVAITLTAVDISRRHKYLVYSIVPSGTYPGSGGETFDFTAATVSGNAKRTGRASLPALPLPANDEIEIVSVSSGYEAALLKNGASPTLKNYLLHFYTTANTELSNASYPAGMTLCVIKVRTKNFY